MSKSVQITAPQVIVVKTGGSPAEWITAGCAVATLAIAATVAKEVTGKIDEYNEKIEKTKDVVTFKNTRNKVKARAIGVVGKFNGKDK